MAEKYCQAMKCLAKYLGVLHNIFNVTINILPKSGIDIQAYTSYNMERNCKIWISFYCHQVLFGFMKVLLFGKPPYGQDLINVIIIMIIIAPFIDIANTANSNGFC